MAKEVDTETCKDELAKVCGTEFGGNPRNWKRTAKVGSKTGTIVRTFVHRDLPLTGLVTSEFDKDSSDTNVTSVSVRVMGPWDDAEGDPDRFYEDSTKRFIVKHIKASELCPGEERHSGHRFDS